MDINNFFQSKTFKIILASLLALVIILLIFSLGLMVGFRKAGFSRNYGDNYFRYFTGPVPGAGMMKIIPQMEGRDFISGHGIIGSIIDIASSTIVVAGENEVEKVISVDDKTIIKRFDQSLNYNDLRVDEDVIIIGQPNQAGQIEARLIRVMPIQLPMFIPKQFMREYF